MNTTNVTISKSLWTFTAQAAHFGVACTFMQAARHFTDTHLSHTSLYVFFAGISLAALKEFWYDYNYETADERGSSPMDFAFYVLGLTIGFLIS